jgi:hypothetical protein
MIGIGTANAHNKLIEALLPADEDAEDGGEEARAAEAAVNLEIRDSDTAKFTWHVYYACALANAIDVHLSTLERRRVELDTESLTQQRQSA